MSAGAQPLHPPLSEAEQRNTLDFVARKPKNIVICCDGTGNEFGDSNSNVVKMYTALQVDAEQIAY